MVATRAGEVLRREVVLLLALVAADRVQSIALQHECLAVPRRVRPRQRPALQGRSAVGDRDPFVGGEVRRRSAADRQQRSVGGRQQPVEEARQHQPADARPAMIDMAQQVAVAAADEQRIAGGHRGDRETEAWQVRATLPGASAGLPAEVEHVDLRTRFTILVETAEREQPFAVDRHRQGPALEWRGRQRLPTGLRGGEVEHPAGGEPRPLLAGERPAADHEQPVAVHHCIVRRTGLRQLRQRVPGALDRVERRDVVAGPQVLGGRVRVARLHAADADHPPAVRHEGRALQGGAMGALEPAGRAVRELEQGAALVAGGVHVRRAVVAAVDEAAGAEAAGAEAGEAAGQRGGGRVRGRRRGIGRHCV